MAIANPGIEVWSCTKCNLTITQYLKDRMLCFEQRLSRAVDIPTSLTCNIRSYGTLWCTQHNEYGWFQAKHERFYWTQKKLISVPTWFVICCALLARWRYTPLGHVYVTNTSVAEEMLRVLSNLWRTESMRSKYYFWRVVNTSRNFNLVS
jgi:hypothetical protein